MLLLSSFSAASRAVSFFFVCAVSQGSTTLGRAHSPLACLGSITEAYGFAQLVVVKWQRCGNLWRCHVGVRPQTLAHPLCDASAKDAFPRRRRSGRSIIIVRHATRSFDGDVCIDELSFPAGETRDSLLTVRQ